MMYKRNKIILSFDLDNTLIDNREGIVDSFNYALEKLTVPKIEKSEIKKMIGIPLNEMFASVSDQHKYHSELISAFREFYGKRGIYQATLLPGIKSKLKQLKDLSFTLGIITSKKQEMAKRVVEILQIQTYFDYVLGETEDRRELGKLDPKQNLLLYLVVL